MGLLSITEMIRTVRKYFLQILALSIAVALLGGYAVSLIQTYTCTLGFKYTHAEAVEGLAPDGVSKLDPYEIQNPVVIQAALNNMGVKEDDELNVKGIRQEIAISKVVTDLDKEVSESAALLGEKYDVNATEYEMRFTYDSSLGDEFGAKMFSNIIKEYDEFLLNKYYNRKNIEDFAKIVVDSDADYIVIADSMNARLEDIIGYLNELADSYPKYRSVKTGYSFAELAELYQNLSNIEYAKYYGNVRAGNLAKDKEMVIKSYQTKVKELQEVWNVNYYISENYRSEISTFYDSYKEAGLYRQAERVQTNLDSTNNRDQDVIDDFDIEKHKNTYDDIILSYAERATNATDAAHSIDYYNNIIKSFSEDNVSKETKDRLTKKNEAILADISRLSADYSLVANETIGELFDSKVNTDLQYLILPEVAEDKPVKLIAIFLAVLTFGMAMIAVLVWELLRKLINSDQMNEDDKKDKIFIDTTDMDEMHKLLYNQYLSGFDEFFLVYQKMVSDKNDAQEHTEVFIRWNSPQMGMVPPGKIIDVVSEFKIFNALNDWIVKSVCENLFQRRATGEKMPIVHINCPYSQISDLALNDIILSHITKYDIPAKNICLELEGSDIAQCLEDIMLLDEMGISICIDKFENSDEEQEIISVVKPGFIKMSLDILNSDMYATTQEDMMQSSKEMIQYFTEMIEKCRDNKITACICGVENKAQDGIVSSIGFDYKQGYYYGKPEKYEM